MNIFRIALPGHNVSNVRLDEEAVDSLYPSPKINTSAIPKHAGVFKINWASDNIVIPSSTTRVLYSFAHGYNYVPSAIGTYAFDNGSTRINGVLPFQYGALAMIVVDCDAKNFNLKYMSLDLGSTPITPFLMNIRFYIMAERGYE